LPVRRLRELEDERLAQSRRLVLLAFGLGGLRGVIQREVAERIARGEERLQRLAPPVQVAVRDPGTRMQVGQPVALVQVGVLARDDVEVEVQSRPFAAPFALAEARSPILDGEVVGLRDIETAAELSLPPACPFRPGRANRPGPQKPTAAATWGTAIHFVVRRRVKWPPGAGEALPRTVERLPCQRSSRRYRPAVAAREAERLADPWTTSESA
jgi:hypothetical protein